ncbi:MAG: VOC family protein [Lewinellaceae bacterium]|nr:VOC family protein [Lewinellaceae bacterium]MCC6282250.1 VOC family protein [Saprospiraceae bacterium]
METTKNAIAWFEIPVSDFERAKKFYETIFDFEMPEMDMTGIRMGILLHNREEGGIGGAICHGDGYVPAGASGPKVYLDCGNDLNTVLGRIPGAGGQVVFPKTEIGPDMGQFAFFTDSEGNVVGLYSTN